jgi:hypothetical protein
VYEQIHGPLGGERDDYLTAKICLTIVEMMRSGGKTPTLKDFMPGWGKQSIGDTDHEGRKGKMTDGFRS